MLTMIIRLALSIFCLLLPLIHGKHLCGQKNVQELIKTSPVILKALGANIFADSRADKLMPDNNGSYSACGGACEVIVLTTATPEPTSIQLTPETFYKGASTLKAVQIADVGEYYEYEGQINVTVDLSEESFNETILNLLPTELIIFGNFGNNHSEEQKFSVNCLQKWSLEFESRIWKYLGWDDWSDFTLCSVTCGIGVQQRFRRCLLDSQNSSPMSQDSVKFFSSRLNASTESKNRGNKKKSVDKEIKKRRRRKGKRLSTLSCEGYNIEQRNCNMFSCKDDISDLLKFYKKPFPLNETLDVVSPTDVKSTPSTAAPTSSMLVSPGLYSGISGALPTVGSSGFVRRWKNPMNFTLMTTLRAKNESKGTILSLRNATHNLYLDLSRNGLKLFQERDDFTEMLPIKLNLYDKQWHQIAISVQNGDFIMIYVDCLWMNSFVVSKRLLALPNDADIEVGRGFKGDIQQLLILPGKHERLQCSTVRTSINEVKRYIIDTFIDDESN